MEQLQISQQQLQIPPGVSTIAVHWKIDEAAATLGQALRIRVERRSDHNLMALLHDCLDQTQAKIPGVPGGIHR
jgi:hypothetical protein